MPSTARSFGLRVGKRLPKSVERLGGDLFGLLDGRLIRNALSFLDDV